MRQGKQRPKPSHPKKPPLADGKSYLLSFLFLFPRPTSATAGGAKGNAQLAKQEKELARLTAEVSKLNASLVEQYRKNEDVREDERRARVRAEELESKYSELNVKYLHVKQLADSQNETIADLERQLESKLIEIKVGWEVIAQEQFCSGLKIQTAHFLTPPLPLLTPVPARRAAELVDGIFTGRQQAHGN